MIYPQDVITKSIKDHSGLEDGKCEYVSSEIVRDLSAAAELLAIEHRATIAVVFTDNGPVWGKLREK